MPRKGFFISRIGEKGSAERIRADEVFIHIVKPVAKDNDVDMVRSDLDPTPGPVTTQIVRSILESDLVIADVTGRNPNVNYELGIAHSFRKPLVILADKVESLSFDTQNERVIIVGDSGQIGVTQADAAKADLQNHLTTVLKAGYNPENIVTSVAASQSLDALAPSNPVAAELAALRESVDKMGTRLNVFGRRLPGGAPKEELNALRAFIEYLSAEGGYIIGDELASWLITPGTSESFDRWVREQVAILDQESDRWDITELSETNGSEGTPDT